MDDFNRIKHLSKKKKKKKKNKLNGYCKLSYIMVWKLIGKGDSFSFSRDVEIFKFIDVDIL